MSEQTITITNHQSSFSTDVLTAQAHAAIQNPSAPAIVQDHSNAGKCI